MLHFLQLSHAYNNQHDFVKPSVSANCTHDWHLFNTVPGSAEVTDLKKHLSKPFIIIISEVYMLIPFFDRRKTYFTVYFSALSIKPQSATNT